jgi:hypothetical protein
MMRAGEVGIVFTHLMNGQPFVMNRAVPMDGGRYHFSPRFLKYYVAEIEFVHDGGRRTSAKDVYLLVDAGGAQRYVAGTYDITSVDSLIFHVGVDRSRNHEDPSLYPEGHPLAHQKPSMHWGWTAGYRFVALEGSAGTTPSTVTNDVQVHSVGNELYCRISLPARSTVTATGIDVVVLAEYSELLHDLDASLGLIFHGLGEETILMTENVRTRVFSAALPSSVQGSTDGDVFTLQPNPATDVVSIRGITGPATLTIIDPLGRAVAHAEVMDNTPVSVAHLPSGTYSVIIASDGSRAHVPLVITR